VGVKRVKRAIRAQGHGSAFDADVALYARKYEKEDYLRFLVCLEKSYGNVAKALRAAGIRGGRGLVNEWVRQNPWFARRFSEVMDVVYEKAADTAQEKVFSSLKSSRRVAEWFLLHHRKGFERGFAKRTFAQVESTSKVSLDLKVQVDFLLQKLTVDELEVLERILRKLEAPLELPEEGGNGGDGSQRQAQKISTLPTTTTRQLQ